MKRKTGLALAHLISEKKVTSDELVVEAPSQYEIIFLGSPVNLGLRPAGSVARQRYIFSLHYGHLALRRPVHQYVRSDCATKPYY